MNTIFQRTNKTLEFALNNILQIMLANVISRHMSFLQEDFILEMEIRITFLYQEQFQQLGPFPKELKEVYNSASAMLYKLLCANTIFSATPLLREDFS